MSFKPFASFGNIDDIPPYKLQFMLIYFYNTIVRLENELEAINDYYRLTRVKKQLTYQDYLDLIVLKCEIETYRQVFDDVLNILGFYDKRFDNLTEK